MIDKPGGMTSHDVVARLRRISGEKSIGHLGTLDPMATGVLPLLLGKFTRLAQYFSTAQKSYSGTIRFGFATDTYDFEGDPIGEKSDPSLTLDLVRSASERFKGRILQRPPAYSAKKINGVPAYKMARSGKPLELKVVEVCVSAFEIEALDHNEATFSMTVSAGAYVRSIAHDLGQLLDCGAHLTSLRRTRAGAFSLHDAHTLAEISNASSFSGGLDALCVHPRSFLREMPSVTADEHTLGRLRNGLQANLAEFSGAPLVKVFAGQSELAGIVKRVAGTLFQPVVVMQ